MNSSGTRVDRAVQVTLKIAQTMDGKIATALGDSRWITGPEARAYGHRLRAEHASILVGVNTVLADDPELTVRLTPGSHPLRVVMDSSLRVPLDARVVTVRPGSTVIATTPDADPQRQRDLESRGVRVIRLPQSGGRVAPDMLVEWLSVHGVFSLLIEGGAAVATSFLRARLVNSLAMFIAPKLVGEGLSAVGDLGITRLRDALTLDPYTAEPVGRDIVVRGQIRWPRSSDHE